VGTTHSSNIEAGGKYTNHCAINVKFLGFTAKGCLKIEYRYSPHIFYYPEGLKASGLYRKY